MPVDYETAVSNLIQSLPFVIAVVVIERRADVVYSTDNWDIKADVGRIISSWSSMKPQSIMISGVKYSIILCTSDRLVATSIGGGGHIIGAKNDERKIIALIEPDGIIPFTTMEIARVLASLSAKRPYLDESTQLGKKVQMMGGTASTRNSIREKKLIADKKPEPQPQKEQVPNDMKAGLPFTARLIAYYRAQEYKRDDPLIVDPFAERLAGDMTSFLNEHIRYSEMDYPIVRSYYIEKNLLKPWCKTHKKSQIVLLGGGLDTRAYRFKPLKKNTHTIFEIDFAIINRYKEEILQGEQPFCSLVRLSANLSNPDWTFHLIKSGFSSNIPTFWVLEGLAYYMEQEEVASLLAKIAEISAENSQVFIDIFQRSRWIPYSSPLNDTSTDPISKYIKWGLNIRDAPSFFGNSWLECVLFLRR